MGLYKPRSNINEIKPKFDQFCQPVLKNKETVLPLEMIEKLLPKPVCSIGERRTQKLATKGRLVNLSPQKIQLPIKDISDGDLSENTVPTELAFLKSATTPQIVLSVSGAKNQPHPANPLLSRLPSCPIGKTNFFGGSGAQKSYETATTITSSKKPTEATAKVDSPISKKEKDSSLQGRWTNEEHRLFVEGIRLFKRDWRSIEKHIGTRTCSQIRSHA